MTPRPRTAVLLLAVAVTLAAAGSGGPKAQTDAPPEAQPPAPPAQGQREQQPDWGVIKTIVIDPGHGGEEVGAVGRTGVYEKDLALDIARRLKTRLVSDHGFNVILTRDDDRVVPLKERTAIANHAAADLFLSIHLNSSRRASAHGTETYFLSLTASDEEALSLARAENRGGARKGDDDGSGADDQSASDLEMVLWGLAQSEHLARSSRLADLIQAEMNRLLGVSSRGIKQAPFAVLMGATMPAVLVEVAFLSNPDEEKKLTTPEFRDRVALALETAIMQFKAESEAGRGGDQAGSPP